MDKKVLTLILFYAAYVPVGFIPFIYESDYNSFVANQLFWVLISIVLRVLVTDIRLKIISEALIILNAVELLDEIVGFNNYLPEITTANLQRLLLDSLIVGIITIITTYRLIKHGKTDG